MNVKGYTESVLGTLLVAALITTLVLPRKNPTQGADAIKGLFDTATNAVYSIFGLSRDKMELNRRVTSRTTV